MRKNFGQNFWGGGFILLLILSKGLPHVMAGEGDNHTKSEFLSATPELENIPHSDMGTDWNGVKSDYAIASARTCSGEPHVAIKIYNPPAYFLPKATQGDEEAQYELGKQYYEGGAIDPRHRIAPDYHEAVKWLRKAADQGNTNAEGKLGELYFDGHGVPVDYEEAYFWAVLATRPRIPNCGFLELLKNSAKHLTEVQYNEVHARLTDWKPTPTGSTKR